MLRFVSLAGVAAALALCVLPGCSTHSDASAGLSLGVGAGSAASPGDAAVALAVGEGATWQATPDGAAQPLRVGFVLPEGAVVESGDGEGVKLLLPGGAGTVTLGSRTRVALNDLGQDGLLGMLVLSGRVEGGITSGTLTLVNTCGGLLQLTPQPGMTAPFSFGSSLPPELWDTMIGLGLNPDVMLPPLASETLLGELGPQTFVAPIAVVPEPGPVALAGIGIAALGYAGKWSCKRSIRRSRA